MASWLSPFGRSNLPAWRSGREIFNPWQDMDRLFEDFTRNVGRTLPEETAGFLNPTVDVSETDKGLEVKADLPGVKQNDVDVELADDVLTIKAERRSEQEQKDEGKHYHLSERSYGTFLRRFRLPFEADIGKVEASFDNGVLRVFVPRPAEAETKAKKIPVSGA